MTIQELIDELNKIPEEDRNKELAEYYGNGKIRRLGRLFFEKESYTHIIGNYSYAKTAYMMMERD